MKTQRFCTVLIALVLLFFTAMDASGYAEETVSAPAIAYDEADVPLIDADPFENYETEEAAPAQATVYTDRQFHYTVLPGDYLTIAIPLVVEAGGAAWATNRDASGNIIAYDAAIPMDAYDQSLRENMAWMSVRMDAAEGESGTSPFAPGTYAEATLLDGFGNRGYAALTDLSIASDAVAGSYTLHMTAQWQSSGSDAVQTYAFDIALTVEQNVQQVPTIDIDPQSILDIPGDAVVTALVSWQAENILLEEEPATGIDAVTGATPDVDGMVLNIRPIEKATEGRRITVPVAVSVSSAGTVWASNTDENGNTLAYGGDGFTSVLPSNVSDLTVTLVAEDFGEDSPFTLVDGAVTEIALIENGVNHGYAAFDGLTVKAGCKPGNYPFTFRLSWRTWPEGDWTPETEETEEAAGGILEALSALFLPSVAYAEAENSMLVEEAVIVEDVVVDCVCCEHCAACYDGGMRLDTDCACVDASGTTVCQCPCPYPENADDPESPLVYCDCDYHLGASILAMSLDLSTATRTPPAGWAYSTDATDANAYLVADDGAMTAIVFTYTQLSAAVAAKMTTVYIGYSTAENTADGMTYDAMPINDGVLTYEKDSTGLKLPTNGQSFVLDGQDPLVSGAPLAKVIDCAASSYLYTFYGTAVTATFRNLVWDGANNYGLITVFGSSTAIFENITYFGVQVVYAPDAGGSVVMNGCDITGTVNPRRTDGMVEEIVQAETALTFTGGDTSLTYINPTSNPAIYAEGTFVFTIDEGTHVDITSEAHVILGSVKEMNINGSLTATLSGNSGGMFYTSYLATTLNVNGTLDITYTPSAGNYAAINATNANINGEMYIRHAPSHKATGTALQVGTTLTVNPGATLEVIRASEGTGTAVTATNAYFLQPARVAIYTKLGRITSANPKQITAGCITVWEGLGDPADGAYGIGATPAYTWNNQGMGAFTYAAGTVTNLDGGTGVAPGAVALDSNSLRLHSTVTTPRYAVIGSPSLTVDPVFYEDHAVTGSTSGTAAIAYQYAVTDQYAPTGSPLHTTAAGDGGYTLPLADGEAWDRTQSMVFVRAYDNSLSPWRHTDAILQGNLSILSVTDIAFENMRLVAAPTLLKRASAMTVTISDSRGAYDGTGTWTPEQWQLSVRQSSPFTSVETAETLQSGMVLVKDSVQTALLGEANVLAATGDSVPGGADIPVTWAEDEGILFELLPNDGLPGNTYTATLLWTLAPAVEAD